MEYRISIEGLRDKALEREIKDLTLTCRLKDRPPATIGQLRRRVNGDLPRIEAVMESRGYYDGTVAADIDPESEPVQVTFRMNPGEVYRFGKIDLRFLDSPDPALEKIRTMIRRDTRAEASRIFDEQKRIIKLLQRKGYPFPELEQRRVSVEPDARRVDVTLEFNVGLRAVYGDFEVEGLESLKSSYIKRQLPWKRGDAYDAKQLDDFEKKLLGTGLFSTARVVPADPGNGSNAVPVKITVTERDQRTIRAGVNYSDIGFGAKVLWEHRNILGGGERLETSLTWSQIELGGKVSFQRPGFLGSNQMLVLDLDASYETPDAYDAKKATASSMVLRKFTEEIEAGLGAGYQYSLVEQLTLTERYGLIFFPLQVVFDYRNNKLNPVRGAQVMGRTAYYHDTLGTESFLKSAAEGRHYHTFWKKSGLSSALRLTVGSIDGTDIGNVPAHERFYAGGGGSIRGYEYQAVGPSAAGVPLGGDKLLEFSVEARLQPGRRFGYVAFLDGGTVYNSIIPETDDRSLRYGAGIGLRWFTGIGPLRLDAAYPLNPDDTQVERVQFYISLGQAF